MWRLFGWGGGGSSAVPGAFRYPAPGYRISKRPACYAMVHQLRDCKYAIEAGDTMFAPRMKALLLRAVVLARRRKTLAESTRRSYRR